MAIFISQGKGRCQKNPEGGVPQIFCRRLQNPDPPFKFSDGHKDKNKVKPPLKNDNLGPFWTILWTFKVNFIMMTPPECEEKALTPPKNSRITLYPP